MLITQPTEQDALFIFGWEGCPLKAYRCPAGVVTIGPGFTMASNVFAAWAKRKWGRGLRMGDAMTREEVNEIFPFVLEEEYGSAVVKAIKPQAQHHYGSAASMTFNCGTGAVKWKWAKALAAGDVKLAADRLRVTAVTSNGRKLAGLVRRRSGEARLMEFADYGNLAPERSASFTEAEVKEYQTQLKTLGYYKGEVDGDRGPLTRGAVLNFQRDHDLDVDGKVGTATRAALIRALDAKRGNQATTTGGATAAGGAGATDMAQSADPAAASDMLFWALSIGIGVTALIFIAFLIFRYRGVLTGRRVPT